MSEIESDEFALHEAVSEENVEEVYRLLNGKADLNKPNDDGETPMILAAQSGNLMILEMLFNAGGCVNTIDEKVYSPLHEACKYNHYDCAKFLIDKGALIEAATDNWKPLHSAAQRGAKNIIKLLLDEGAEVNPKSTIGDTPLHWTSKLSDTSCAEILLKYGANVNAKNSEGIMPLHFAVYHGSEDIVDFLLDNSAEIDGQDEKGRTALYFAAECIGEQMPKMIIKKLLARGANPNIENKKGFLPFDAAHDKETKLLLEYKNQSKKTFDRINRDYKLHIAAKKGDAELFCQLLPPHDVNQQNQKGQTVLVICAKYGRSKLIKEFLECTKKSEIDKELPDNSGNTPFLAAAASGSKTSVSLLLNYRVNLYATNEFGLSALHKAATRGHIEIMKSLLLAEEEYRNFVEKSEKNKITKLKFVKLTDNNGYTALHHLMKIDSREGVELLLHYGADVNAKSHKNITPLHLAAHFTSIKIIKILLEEGADIYCPDFLGRLPYHWAFLPECDPTVSNLMKKEALQFNQHDKFGSAFDTIPRYCPVSSFPFL